MNIVEKVAAFHDKLRNVPYDRYRSWEHCYRFFQNNPTDIDLASLHLAVYLASWGMYRGSSHLLQKDYRVHCDVVSYVLSSKYLPLRAAFEDFNVDPALINNLSDLHDQIAASYQKNGITPTLTLVTKVLLGTLGCTPAYDQFFKAGLRQHQLKCSLSHFPELLAFCATNRFEFYKARDYVSAHGFRYPLMKIVDMYFWQIGSG